ncbi:hypothetical protein VVR12_01775 [Rothia sp. LK2588]|uniref:hypothetical protein n=1 Tax=Rothia sp. LK2588 TaxID=3114369 RepID=UPI0034CE0738
MAIYLVTGPPGAGKTTYAQEHMRPGDQLIDFDLIKNESDSERVARARRLDLEDQAKDYNGGDVWITRSLPAAADREEFSDRIGVTKSYVLETPKETSRQRAISRDGDTSHAQYIDQWWEKYSPSSRDEVIKPPDRGNTMSDHQNPDTSHENSAADTATDSPAKKPLSEMSPAEAADYWKSYSRKHESENRRLVEQVDQLTNAAKHFEDQLKQREHELNAQWGKKLAAQSVELLASKLGFADPSDATRFLDLTDVMSDGDVNTKALEEKLTDLAKDRPYLIQKIEDDARLRARRIHRAESEGDKTPQKTRAADALRSYARNK